MNALKAVWAELIGLFVDDEFLAVAILAVVALAALLATLAALPPLGVGAVLFLGCLGALVVGVWRTARR